MRLVTGLVVVMMGWAAEPQYTPLKQITPANVKQLVRAWTYDTKDAFAGSEMQCRPVFSRGVLYATTPKGRLVAIDAGTGAEKWSFDPTTPGAKPSKFRNRGITLYRAGETERVFYGVKQFVYAVDGKTGKLVPGFGNGG